MKDKFVVTGTGRCGTQYVASVLTICGIKCGHQKIDYGSGVIRFGNLDGDASFKAMNYLGWFEKSKVKVIGLYRHPVKVIRSILELNQVSNFVDHPKWTFGIRALCAYYNRVNLTLKKEADILFDIDTIDLKRLFRFIGFADKYDDNLVNAIPTDANSRNEQKERTLELVDRDIHPDCLDVYNQMKKHENTSNMEKL